jgi:hypothetical protein
LHSQGLQSAPASLMVGTARAMLFAAPLPVRQLVYDRMLRGKANA